MIDHDEHDGQSEHDETDERHRAECSTCAGLWADIELISAEARALPPLTPSRDLWRGIEARISAGSSAVVSRVERRWYSSTAVRLATAASLLVAATAGVTWRLANDRAADDLPIVAAVPTARQASYEADMASMDREIGTLQSLVDAKRDQLDPRTVEVLERNLKVIDQAIAESRAAFLQDPASGFLATRLARSYSNKLTLLRSTATMPFGT